MTWFEQLKRAVDESSCADVARRIGVSRSAISLLVNNKYQGDTSRMAVRIKEYFSRVICPESGLQISRAQCRANVGNVPTSSPAAVRQWKACRKCPHQPKGVK